MYAVARPQTLLLLAAMIAPLLAGCNPAGKLVGKWELEADKLQASMPAVGGDNPMVAAMASSMMEMMKFEMDLEFKGDGNCLFTVGMLGQSQSKAGKWRYVRSEGDVLVLMVKTDEQAEEHEVKVKFIDNDHLETIPPVEAASAGGPKALPFRRVKG